MRRSKKQRLEAKGWRFGTTQDFLGLSDEALRGAGLSASKMKSLRDLAHHVHGGIVGLEAIHELADEDVIDALASSRPSTFRSVPSSSKRESEASPARTRSQSALLKPSTCSLSTATTRS